MRHLLSNTYKRRRFCYKIRSLLSWHWHCGVRRCCENFLRWTTTASLPLYISYSHGECALKEFASLRLKSDNAYLPVLNSTESTGYQIWNAQSHVTAYVSSHESGHSPYCGCCCCMPPYSEELHYKVIIIQSLESPSFSLKYLLWPQNLGQSLKNTCVLPKYLRQKEVSGIPKIPETLTDTTVKIAL